MSSSKYSSLHRGNHKSLLGKDSRRFDCRTEKEAHPERLGAVLEEIFDEMGLTRKLLEYRVTLVWEEAVGRVLSRQSRALRMRNGHLEVAVPSAVFRQQLMLMKRQIISKINDLVGQNIVEELSFRNQRME